VVVISTLKRSPSDLASYQKKIFKIDDHMGIGISGLVADARVISHWMRNECLSHKYVYETPMQCGRLVAALSDKSQVYTQKAEKRPYGVGLLVAGYDKTGPHLYQTSPSGTFYEYKAQAMGARSQSAKTYLEKHFESFEKCSTDELIKHSLIALKGTSQSGSITHLNCAVAVVGKNIPFTVYEDDTIRSYVAAVADEEGEKGGDDDKKGDDDDDDSSDKKESGTEVSAPSSSTSGSSGSSSSTTSTSTTSSKDDKDKDKKKKSGSDSMST